jgi:hypothetical protein
MHAFMSARPSRHSDAALRLLRDAEVSDLPPHEIAAAVVLALMIIVINVGLLVWVMRKDTSRHVRLLWPRSLSHGDASNAWATWAALVPFPFSRSELAGHAHHAVAKALHIELAHVAFPVCGFGLLFADQLATHLF